MEQNEMLDNLSGQVIKEMINRKEITIEELSTRALDTLFDYESELVCAGESDEELLLQIAKLLDPISQTDEAEQKYRNLIHTALKSRTIHDQSVGRKRPRLPKALIIAATFLVLTIAISVIAGALGFSVFANIRELMGMPAGSRLEKEAITLVHLGESKEYVSIEELLRDQNFDILYPTMLPASISIESVYVFETENGEQSISFFTDCVSTAIIVDTNIGTPPNEYADSEKYDVGGREYYLFEDEMGYYAVCYDKKNFYRICSTNRENIILIINNMKELEQ